MPISNLPPGTKLVLETQKHRGFGTLQALDGRRAVIRYYSSPFQFEELTESADRIAYELIGPQTRVFRQSGDGVQLGRVLICTREFAPPREYLVKWEGQPPEQLLETDFEVRSCSGEDSPFLSLEHLAGASPFFAEIRNTFIDEVMRFRNAAAGLNGISSAKVLLYPHQIQVARQVLSDPTMRYLLADEVGLGKTIEAGFVLRQMALDHEPVSAVVCVPGHLIEQWRDELASRFNLSNVPIIPHAQLSMDAVRNCSILVIDEAHKVIRQGEAAFEELRNIALAVPHLLLLSATPVLHHEEQLLRLLHLLDPGRWPLDRLDHFRSVIKRRQELGRLLYALEASRQAFTRRRNLVALGQALPNDEVVTALVRGVDAASEEDLCRRAHQARQHVSDGYRLHRRMLRTRRQWLLEDLNIGARRMTVHLEYGLSDGLFTGLWEALEEWRITAISENFDGMDAYFCLAGLIATDCHALSEFLERLIPKQLPPLRGYLESMLDQARHAEGQDQVGLLMEFMLQKARQNTPEKCVVFAPAHVLNRVSREAAEEERLAKVLACPRQAEDLHEAIERFEEDEDLIFLLCDERFEEGVNLHFADTILLFDLPLDPMRIEQRLGRLDRLVRQQKVKVICFATLDAEDSGQGGLDDAWLHMLDKGMGVFNASLSDIQFLVEDEMRGIKHAAWEAGPEGLCNLVDKIRGRIEEERRLLAEQDVIDGFGGSRGDGGDYVGGLVEAENRARQLGDAFASYAKDCLGLVWRDGRLHRGARDPQIAAALLQELQFAVGRSATVNREYAVRNGHEFDLLRPGTPLLESMARIADRDQRGRSFAMYRYCPEIDHFRLVFRVRVIVRLAWEQVSDEVGVATGDARWRMNAYRLVRGWFPDQLITCFLEAGEEVGEDLRSLCEHPYDKRRGDRNLGDRRWFIEKHFGLEAWGRQCREVERTVLEKARREERVQSLLVAARERAHHYMGARRLALGVNGAAEAQGSRDEKELNALEADISKLLGNPLYQIESAGAYYLTPDSLDDTHDG